MKYTGVAKIGRRNEDCGTAVVRHNENIAAAPRHGGVPSKNSNGNAAEL